MCFKQYPGRVLKVFTFELMKNHDKIKKMTYYMAVAVQSMYMSKMRTFVELSSILLQIVSNLKKITEKQFNLYQSVF